MRRTRKVDAAFLDDFRRTVDRAAERLLAFSDADAGRSPAPGKWSKKEIIGHLDRPWNDLVRLWQAYNHHIALVMGSADPHALMRPRSSHNLHELAWQPVPPSEAATLDYF